MRMTAPVVGGAAIVAAVTLVWYLGPDAKQSVVPHGAAIPVQGGPPVAGPAVAAPNTAAEAAARPPAADVSVAEAAASPTPGGNRAPLPGETPATPMSQLIADRQNNMMIRQTEPGPVVPPGLTAGELEFATEPVDATWAPGAEADLLATFAQMPGLKLIDLQVECRSTMCRLQLTQPAGVPAESVASPPFNLLRDSLGLEPRWMMAVAGDGSGSLRSVAYLWREGFASKRKSGQSHETE